MQEIEPEAPAPEQPVSYHRNGSHPKLPERFEPAYREMSINRINQATRYLANGPSGAQVKPEVLYAALIKSGDVRVVRRRGKPPVIQWLKQAA